MDTRTAPDLLGGLLAASRATPPTYIVTWTRSSDAPGVFGWATTQETFRSREEALAAAGTMFTGGVYLAVVEAWAGGQRERVAVRRRKRKLILAGGHWPDQPEGQAPTGVAPGPFPRRDWDSALVWLLDRKAARLSAWERQFVESLADRRAITGGRQWQILDRIWACLGCDQEWTERQGAARTQEAA